MRKLAEGLVFTGFAYQPPVRDFGDFEAARLALKGTLAIGGYRAPLSDLTPWDLALPDPALAAELHGFGWLDDMEALSGKTARARAQGWTLGWLDRFGDGLGPGWAPGVTGPRLRRLLTHVPFLEKNLNAESLARIQTALPLHARYLEESWRQESEDTARVAALSGLVHGTICLNGFEDRVQGALDALGSFAADRVSEGGGIASRNPEALLVVFREFLGVRALLEETGRPPLVAMNAAIGRIAPTLRALRHGDGTLARFHGGGGAVPGLPDRAMAESKVRTRPGRKPAMGYVRLHGGRVHVIVDCARPPERSDHAHASTLAFEMSSGRRPLIVSCGPAIPQAPGWARAARTTAAHSTLALDKTSSSKFAPARMAGKPGFDALQSRPSMVTVARAEDETGMWIQTRHDGYLEDYGLLHERRLFVGALGREVHGEDVLLSPDAKAKKRFQARIKGAEKLGVALAIHFHLHPDAQAQLIRREDAVRIRLKSGEVWIFRHEGGLMDLEANAWLDPALPEPVPTQQIVVRHRTTTPAAEISWSLVRENAGGPSPRDLGVDAPEV